MSPQPRAREADGDRVIPQPGQGSVSVATRPQPALSAVMLIRDACGPAMGALTSLVDATQELGDDLEVILLDHGCRDDTPQLIEALGEDVVGVRVDRGLGVRDAWSAGLARAHGTWVLLLTPDIRFEPGWLAPLAQTFLDDDRVGAVSPMLVDTDGQPSQSRGMGAAARVCSLLRGDRLRAGEVLHSFTDPDVAVLVDDVLEVPHRMSTIEAASGPRRWRHDVVLPRRTSILRPPRFFGEPPLPSIVDVDQPADYVAHLEDVVVTGASATVLTCDGVALNDDFASPFASETNFDSSIGRVQSGRYYALRQFREPHALDRAVLLCGPAPGNWFHWLVESLGRLWTLEQADVAPDVPLLVDAAVMRIPSMVRALELVDRHARPVITIDEGSEMLVHRLVVPSTPFRHPTRLMPGVLIRTEHYSMVPEAVAFLHDRLALAPNAPLTRPGWRVFMSRPASPNQRLRNETALVPVLEAHGFEIVRPELLSFDEQRALYAGAAAVVGASGAGFANLLLAPPGTRAICTHVRFEIGTPDFPVFSTLAHHLGQRLLYLGGRPVRIDPHEYYQSDYEIDPSVLDAALTSMDL